MYATWPGCCEPVAPARSSTCPASRAPTSAPPPGRCCGRRCAPCAAHRAVRTVRCALSTPDSEQAGDKWDLAVLGLPGRLDFTKISQRWLREATKHWAAEDLP